MMTEQREAADSKARSIAAIIGDLNFTIYHLKDNRESEIELATLETMINRLEAAQADLTGLYSNLLIGQAAETFKKGGRK